MKILFVCTGNTCRSPMAEAIFNDIAKKQNLAHSSFSKGTNVFFDQPLNKKAANALSKMGIAPFEHISKQIDEQDIKDADIILTMTAAHKMAVKSMFPKCFGKIFTLNEKAYGKDSPISDPFGQSEQVYIECAQEIQKSVEALVNVL